MEFRWTLLILWYNSRMDSLVSPEVRARLDARGIPLRHIYNAFQRDNLFEVNALLSPNRNNRGRLHAAVWDVDDFLGNTNGLMIASDAGALGVVSNLVTKRNANVNMVDREVGNTALILASGNGHLEVVKLLVKKGQAEVNIRNVDGATALMFASAEGHLDVVKFLVENGAATGHKTSEGYTALDLAKDENHNDIIEYLSNIENAAEGGYRRKTRKLRKRNRKQTKRR